jgi:prephenate dehydrogenase
MDIGIVGLGLIGSSFARAVKKHTGYSVAGWDADPDVLSAAVSDGILDEAGEAAACACGIVLVCLYPVDAVRFIEGHPFAHIVCDVCGVKGFLADRLSDKVKGYVGLHPMAGREFSGYRAGSADLFSGASLVITPDENTHEAYVREVCAFAREIGFERIVKTDPKTHDRVIAYTSQLAHVVSNAYVKSPSACEYVGFSAGSFADLTRVARLDPNMWTELFLENKENLLAEIDNLTEQLARYREALEKEDEKELFRLLSEGRDRKNMLDALLKSAPKEE